LIKLAISVMKMRTKATEEKRRSVGDETREERSQRQERSHDTASCIKLLLSLLVEASLNSSVQLVKIQDLFNIYSNVIDLGQTNKLKDNQTALLPVLVTHIRTLSKHLSRIMTRAEYI